MCEWAAEEKGEANSVLSVELGWGGGRGGGGGRGWYDNPETIT